MERQPTPYGGRLLLLAGSLCAYPIMVPASIVANTDMGGSLSYTYRDVSHATGTEEQQQIISFNIRHRFYLLEEWLMSGDADLLLSEAQTATRTTERTNSMVTGSMGLNVLPQSRFPFRVAFRRADSRLSYDLPALGDELVPGDRVVTDYLTLNQSYQGPRYRLSFSHAQQRQTSDLRGTYGSDMSSADGIWRFSGQDFMVRYTQRDEHLYQRGERSGETASIQHSYSGHPQIGINNMVSFTSTEQVLPTTDGIEGATYATELGQASSTFAWRSLDSQTSLTGGLRYYGVAIETEEQMMEQASLNGTVGVLHRLTQNWSVNWNSSRTRNLQEEDARDLTYDRFGTHYRSNRIGVGRFGYQWVSGLTLADRRGDEEREREGTLSLGHDLARDWIMRGRGRIHVRASQDWYATRLWLEGEPQEVEPRVMHRVTAGWSQGTSGGSRRLQLTYSDSRDLHEDKVMKNYTAELSEQSRLTRRMSLDWRYSYRQTDLEYADAQLDSRSSSSNAGLRFNYLQPFSVRGLLFSSEMLFSEHKGVSVVDDTIDRSWNNRLTYRVGKLETSLQHMDRKSNNNEYNLTHFNLRRHF